MKLKMSKAEAEIIRDALAARVNIWTTLAKHPRNHAAREQKTATEALIKRLFIKELV